MKPYTFFLIVIVLISACKKINPVEQNQPVVEPKPKELILKTQEVVFYSSDRDGKAINLYMMSTNGDSIKQITKFSWGEYAATAISPDSSKLLFYQSAPGLDIDVGMDIYIYKIKEDTIIGPITQGHPGNFTPDGNKIVLSRHHYTEEGGFESVYLYDLINNIEAKLTEDGKTSFYPQISPDGKTICYESAKFRPRDSMSCWQLHLMDIDGSNIKDITKLGNGYYAGNGVFTPDGKSIIYHYNEMTWCYDICKINITDKTINYLTNARSEGNYDTSPNYWNPYINTNGTKVYFYSKRYDTILKYITEICSANIDGTGFKKLTNNSFWDSHPVVGTVSFYIEK